MIYSQATGGFGNQLYNYAIGLALSEMYSEPLTIDVSAYKYSCLLYTSEAETV